MDEVLETIYGPDGTRRVHIVRRKNGTFGHEEEYFSTDEYEMCWIPLSRHLSVFDSAETALREARSRMGWLLPPEETGSSMVPRNG
jgi:hypothetical protein